MAEELAAHRERERVARRALEEQVASRTSELTAALDAQSAAESRRRQLFADISHELRTPTTTIRGEAQIALRGEAKPAAEYQQSLRRIVEASRQLATTIDDLLTMARSDHRLVVPAPDADRFRGGARRGAIARRKHGACARHRSRG